MTRIKWIAALAVAACLVTWSGQSSHAQMPPLPIGWEILSCNSDGTYTCRPWCDWEICCDD